MKTMIYKNQVLVNIHHQIGRVKEKYVGVLQNQRETKLG